MAEGGNFWKFLTIGAIGAGAGAWVAHENYYHSSRADDDREVRSPDGETAEQREAQDDKFTEVRFIGGRRIPPNAHMDVWIVRDRGREVPIHSSIIGEQDKVRSFLSFIRRERTDLKSVNRDNAMVVASYQFVSDRHGRINGRIAVPNDTEDYTIVVRGPIIDRGRAALKTGVLTSRAVEDGALEIGADVREGNGRDRGERFDSDVREDRAEAPNLKFDLSGVFGVERANRVTAEQPIDREESERDEDDERRRQSYGVFEIEKDLGDNENVLIVVARSDGRGVERNDSRRTIAAIDRENEGFAEFFAENVELERGQEFALMVANGNDDAPKLRFELNQKIGSYKLWVAHKKPNGGYELLNYHQTDRVPSSARRSRGGEVEEAPSAPAPQAEEVEEVEEPRQELDDGELLGGEEGVRLAPEDRSVDRRRRST